MNPIIKKLFIGEFTWKRLIRSLLLIPVFVYLGIVALAWFVPNKLLFRPQAAAYADNESIIKLKTADGETISAKFYKNAEAKYTILFSHGNAEDIGRNDEFTQTLHDKGFSVFAYDYHGYGTSTGEPTEENTYKDINAAYKYLTETLAIPANRIIVHGRSVGGGPSVDLASREPVAGLILESTFTSASRVLTKYRLLPFEKFNNLSKLPGINCPILVIHGRKDSTIPFHHGEALLAAANEPKAFLWIDDAGHNNVFAVAGEKYLAAIRDFASSLTAR